MNDIMMLNESFFDDVENDELETNDDIETQSVPKNEFRLQIDYFKEEYESLLMKDVRRMLDYAEIPYYDLRSNSNDGTQIVFEFEYDFKSPKTCYNFLRILKKALTLHSLLKENQFVSMAIINPSGAIVVFSGQIHKDNEFYFASPLRTIKELLGKQGIKMEFTELANMFGFYTLKDDSLSKLMNNSKEYVLKRNLYLVDDDNLVRNAKPSRRLKGQFKTKPGIIRKLVDNPDYNVYTAILWKIMFLSGNDKPMLLNPSIIGIVVSNMRYMEHNLKTRDFIDGKSIKVNGIDIAVKEHALFICTYHENKDPNVVLDIIMITSKKDDLVSTVLDKY